MCDPKWVFSPRGGGVVPLLVWTQMSTTLGDFVTLWLTPGCALGPLEASVIGSKMSSQNVRYHTYQQMSPV